MGVGYEVEVGEQGVVVRLLERPTVELIAAAAEAMSGHPAFTPSVPSIWDLSGAPDAGLSADDMRRIASLVAHIREGGGRPRVAVVTPRDAGFAGARMFGGLNEPRMNIRFGVFRSLAEAKVWVARPAGENGEGAPGGGAA